MNKDKRAAKRPVRTSASPLCLVRAASFLVLLLSINVFAANEETFAKLKVGNHVYQNVRVTTKGKNFIIISHAGGITSLKLSELPDSVLKKLGYPSAQKKRLKEPAMLAGFGRQSGARG
jgi:hypothetical protein